MEWLDVIQERIDYILSDLFSSDHGQNRCFRITAFKFVVDSRGKIKTWLLYGRIYSQRPICRPKKEKWIN